ncbi:glycosyltransferase family 4 protein [Escherichia albertii]|uniref:Predicted glycosyltransferase n=1 Tax=Escherichia albertii TaxID=208962 RepID=A0A5A4U4H2_ESCAL|nr:glycosyltransferase family 4 protein [Escherichia albertii]EEX2836893.1 glycosyltransferase family 4 protein [Escherichia albertii]MCE7722635.1 glycosyltransferase family 4 protein [Escherichia albertii]MCE7726885.1 glycosyltransferase family 4 protein [Escherichia albertii]MCZ8779456.1 glycosyltransferase family 4 protein [Escherichia albertii]BBM62579.1 predicted glycosyltransferase [Escherichia albertii]
MNKILYISLSLDEKNYGGSIVSRNNLKALRALEDSEVKEVAIVKKPEGIYEYELQANVLKTKIAIDNLKGYAGRLNDDCLLKIKDIIRNFEPKFVYLDSSLLGGIAKLSKDISAEIKVITFFHNVEIDFELERLKSGQILFLPSILSSYLAEKKAIKYSDIIISLHQSDSARLKCIYGRASDFCVPVCIEDDLSNERILHKKSNKDGVFKVGFMGTAFFANIKAAEFISKKISPIFLNDKQIEFVIAGNGFDKYSKLLNRKNVKTLGYIESIEEFYNEVDVIISPVLSGAGMKVKIAEAIKYNKKVIASSFSLIGYEEAFNSQNIVSCITLDDYVMAIKKLNSNRMTLSDTREYYLKYFSNQACIDYFKYIFTFQ